MREYFINVLIGLDQLVNALFGGEPDETISSRWGRGRNKVLLFRAGAAMLDAVDKDHCAKAVESERQRAHLPEELRQ